MTHKAATLLFGRCRRSMRFNSKWLVSTIPTNGSRWRTDCSCTLKFIHSLQMDCQGIANPGSNWEVILRRTRLRNCSETCVQTRQKSPPVATLRLVQSTRANCSFLRWQADFCRRLATTGNSCDLFHRDQTWYGDPQSDDMSAVCLQFRKIVSHESHKFFRSFQSQIFVCEHTHLPIVAFLTSRVHITRATKAADVTVEVRADVIQFMEYGDHFFFERQVQKSRQEERQNIKRFASLMSDSLHGPQMSSPSFDAGTTFKPQWCQSSLNAPFDR